MRCFRRCLFSGALAAILAFAAATPGMAEERIVQVSPRGPVAAGQDVVLRITTREILPPSEARLHYRTIGSSDFFVLPMTRDTEVAFSAILPGRKLLPPGIEYFFAVKDGRGRVFTSPELDPRKNPFSIPVSLGGAAFQQLAFPGMDGSRVEGPRPAIVINLADIEGSAGWSSLRLLVDEVDVSPLVVLEDGVLRYTPEAPLDYGRHTVVLESMDAAGAILPARSWTFVVPQSEVFDKASATVTVDAEAGVKIVGKSGSSEPDWKIQSSATLNSVAEKGDFKVSLEANGWLTEQEGDEETGDTFNLNNYLLQIEYRRQRLALGDLTVEGTELTGESIARRGALLELNVDGTRAQAFMVRSTQTTGFDDMTGLDRSNQRLIGGSLRQELLDDGRLVVKGTAITGKNADPDGYNTGTLAAPSKGQIYSLALASRPWAEVLHLSGEYSFSRYDEDTTDSHGLDSGRAWLVRLSGRAGSYDYGGGYKRLGRDFRSIANVTGVENREEYTLYGTKTFRESNLTASLLYNRDNVEKDSELPVIRNTSLDLAWNLFKADWPNVFLNGNLTFQDSADEPNGTDPVKNLSQTLGGGFSIVREKWNLTPTYTFTRFSDDSPADADGRTHQATLNFGWQPDQRVSLNPSVSYGRTDTGSDSVTETWQGTLAGTFVFNERQDLYLTLSVLDSRTDDHSVETTSYDGVCQYNWLLDLSFLEKVRKTLSLRGRYNRTDDRAGDASDEDYSIFLLLSMGGLSLSLI
jgi:hypothetical protein